MRMLVTLLFHVIEKPRRDERLRANQYRTPRCNGYLAAMLPRVE